MTRTPADELDAAAALLREAAFRSAMTATPAVAALVRAREPLADWLESTAVSLRRSTHPAWQEEVAGYPLAVARQLLDTTPATEGGRP
ncbi:hypothetical protein [Streptomyces sp. C10-9-1]|uniref:hypothetical protein n=1 Tax=Streptomyces sp. C10-9-1 TaxID=1859285 RepID=UPI003D7349F2